MPGINHPPLVQCWCWRCLGRQVDPVAKMQHNREVTSSMARPRDEITVLGWVYKRDRPAPVPKFRWDPKKRRVVVDHGE